ncbi:MAG TPA: glycoside hydrolase domain-containing protein [Mycobacteriales bacterium]|nr:glycoside hydrolase domain-containing protein [Mycobacteriales bacterium]
MRKKAVVVSVAGAVGLVASVAVGTVLVQTRGGTGTAGSAGAAGAATASRQIRYAGYTARVPASWPVYDLSKDPTRCVRFDRHAVYLGTPGADQHCPAHLVGRTEALLVQPLTPKTAAGGGSTAGELHRDLPRARVAVTATYRGNRSLASSLVSPVAPSASTEPGTPTATPPASPGTSAPGTPGPSGTATPGPVGSPEPTGSPTGAAPSPTPSQSPSTDPTDPTGATTATDTPSGQATGSTAPSAPSASGTPADSGSATPTGGSTAVPQGTGTPTSPAVPEATTGSTTVQNPPDDHLNVQPSPTAVLPTLPIAVPSTLLTTGLGFDTCAAPSAATMQAWQPSSLNSVGVYIGGENRSCPDGNLSASWARTVHADGYSLLPIYVGLQAPCNARTNLAKIDPAQAGAQGVAAADTAVSDMQRFGMGTGNVVYLDMEFYDSTPSCTTAVLDFVSGWTVRLHQLQYVSGVYGNATSVAQDMARAALSQGPALPDALWFARWNNTVDVDATPYVPDTLWVGRRAKQYQAPHNETHGGVTINIDGDYIQGPIALPGTFAPTP